MKHYQRAGGGDEILVDLGNYGLHICLDSRKRWYDIEYVEIGYKDSRATPRVLPADMVVRGKGREHLVLQADSVRIWRHGPERPSARR